MVVSSKYQPTPLYYPPLATNHPRARISQPENGQLAATPSTACPTPQVALMHSHKFHSNTMPRSIASALEERMYIMTLSFLSADGACVIDLTQTSFPSHVHTKTIWQAASLIPEFCLNDPPLSGGQAFRIGDEENFLITTDTYGIPRISCVVQPIPWQPASFACRTILESMKADIENTTFAARGVAVAGDVTVPLALDERKTSLEDKEMAL
ncbi:hypothetical protein N7G274_005130 [Stereocaulon virgatum]|uniref:Uncharacterized protein n=1 Tax=Stereocaulon virgatum TaxID=373712 RepID=A0ABR4ABS0_9LECA